MPEMTAAELHASIQEKPSRPAVHLQTATVVAGGGSISKEIGVLLEGNSQHVYQRQQ